MVTTQREWLKDSCFTLGQVIIDGRPHRAFRIICHRCERFAEVPMNNMSKAGGVSADDKERRMAARKFEKTQWLVDLRHGKHVCPVCLQKAALALNDKPTLKVMEQAMDDNKVVPIAPKTMNRDDRRIIFEKINEVYINEREGYAAPWTDDKVAKDLGSPRSWVTQVREEMFGPAQSNAEIDEAVKAAKELAQEVLKHAEQSQKLSGAVECMLKRLDQIIKAVGGK